MALRSRASLSTSRHCAYQPNSPSLPSAALAAASVAQARLDALPSAVPAPPRALPTAPSSAPGWVASVGAPLDAAAPNEGLALFLWSLIINKPPITSVQPHTAHEAVWPKQAGDPGALNP